MRWKSRTSIWLVLKDIEMPVMEERCLAAGMDAYIAKPLSPDVLTATMEQVLGD